MQVVAGAKISTADLVNYIFILIYRLWIHNHDKYNLLFIYSRYGRK